MSATIKQRKAFAKIVENNGNISKSMIEAGYDETTAKNPKNLTESKGWKELMEDYLPDALLGEKHLALLNKVGEDGEIDVQAVAKGLDMAYKLKGAYAPEKNLNLNADIRPPHIDVSNPRVIELLQELREIGERECV